MSYKVVIDAKRTKREEEIRETAALTTRDPSKEEQRITSSSGTFYFYILQVCSNVILAGQIIQAIREGRWTSTQVVTAFIKSAIRAQDETNCVTEGAPLFCLGSDIALMRWVLSAILGCAEDRWRTRCSLFCDEGAQGSITWRSDQFQGSQ